MRNIRSRTTMSHAFEAALQPYLTVASNAASELATMVAQKMSVGFREAPAWTAVTRMANTKAAERKAGRKTAR